MITLHPWEEIQNGACHILDGSRGEIQISGSRAELQENKGGDAVGEDDSG